MYRKKMAFVIALKQHRQRLPGTENVRMNIHLASRNDNTQVLQMVGPQARAVIVHEWSSCRPQGLCEITTGPVLVIVRSRYPTYTVTRHV